MAPSNPDAQQAQATGELTLITGGQRLSGWQAMRVTRGCERMPSDFEVELVEQYPGDPSEIIVAPGTPCEVLLGADRVLTGYIDRYTASISAHDHGVRISGRSMCEDLVDSSAILPNMAVSGGTFLSIAEKLAQPYGITVKSQTQRAGDPFKQFNVTLGETPYEIIERVARYFRVLVYDDTDGNLILADVGASSMASGFSIGDNVQSATSTFTADQRFGTYVAARMNTAIGSDIAAKTGNNGYYIGEVSDPGAPTTGANGKKRLRQLLVVSEQIVDGHDLALSRAEWEMNRRVGRSQVLTVVCDSWRDKNGTLWQPNAFAPLRQGDARSGRITPHRSIRSRCPHTIACIRALCSPAPIGHDRLNSPDQLFRLMVRLRPSRAHHRLARTHRATGANSSIASRISASACHRACRDQSIAHARPMT